MTAQNLKNDSIDIIINSWRKSTRKTYNTFLTKWFNFTKKNRINPIKPTVGNFITFLTSLFKSKLSYATICIARSAVNQFLLICTGRNFGNSLLVQKLLKGIFELRPVLHRSPKVWCVGTVLTYLDKLPNNLQLSLMLLSCKLCTLFLLVTAQRCQTLHLIHVNDIQFTGDKMTVQTNHVLKQTRPKYHLPDIVIQQFTKNEKLCIVSLMKDYLRRTNELRGDTQRLLISTQKPHKGVARDTISRWVRFLLRKAGVEEHYTAHSVRAASTSRALKKGVSLQSILSTAGWSQAKTFHRFYSKHIQAPVQNEQNGYANVIIE